MRLRALLLTAFVAGTFLAAEHLSRPAAGDQAYLDRLKPGHCPCAQGQGCWHYLRSPLKPPIDECRCGCCIAGGTCEGKDRPKGTSGACWSSGKEECFWKRHAHSWKLQCSECWTNDECQACDEDLGNRDPKVVEWLTKSLEFEGSSKKWPLTIVRSPHFYVVTDLENKVKVPVQGGAFRIASAHEIAHLYAQRAENAWEDFVHWFGPVSLSRPMAVYLVDKGRTEEEIQAKYFGGARTDMNYGQGQGDRIAGGRSGNGFCACYSEEGSDLSMHAYVRHMVGHILFSCWAGGSPFPKECPTWAFEGAAYFLEKLLPEHFDLAHYCTSETTAPSGSPKDWDKRSRALAAGRLDPIETWFGRNSLGSFTYEDRVRSWSVFDLGLREDRDRFLKTLRMIRSGSGEGPAFKEGMGFTSDEFHKRWVDRLTGKRPTLGEMKKEDDPEVAGSRERAKIQAEQEPEVLAGLIRGVHKIEDLKMMQVVVGRLDHPSDHVRESIHLVLMNSATPENLAWLRTQGLLHKDALGRAGVARVLGAYKDAASRTQLEQYLETDGHWLVRANCAQALGQIGDKASLPVLVKALDEKQPKPWIAIADALAHFGEKSKEATLATAPNLAHSDWQVRLTACRALVRYGTEDALDALIDRYALEGGRLQKELRAALKAVARDDLGENADTWRKWWTEQKAKHGGRLPPDAPAPRNPADDRYAPPKPATKDEPRYYGRRIFSRAIGFVLDTSGSMETLIKVPEASVKKLGDVPSEGTRGLIAKTALAESLRSLDPRARFQLVFFSTDVRPWKDTLTQASAGNVDAAVGAVESASLEGETNIHGALKAALGLHGKTTLEASLDPIPDTVYFLTDGSPTRGEITSTPELLSWFQDLNRFAKVELHVIAMGTLGVDLEFLRKLAASGGGEFIHIAER
jgi:hypothetical protein